jgi:hypothetical protein
MDTAAMFPLARARAGMYESFYLRAVSPVRPLGVWIRHTVSKPPGERAHGSLWCTVFDASPGAPFMHKLTGAALRVPREGWIELGEQAPPDERAEPGERARAGVQGGQMSERAASGACGTAAWSLRIERARAELRHLPRQWLYRAPLPRTKLTSPAPLADFSGRLRIGQEREIELDGWHGMVGHNWGAEHAERWIWLHGVDFAGAEETWIDVALGRLLIGGRLTPWVANGGLCLEGRRLRLGGLAARGLRVEERPDGCTLSLPGERGLRVQARAAVPVATAAGWRYNDPDGGAGHDVVNCSIAGLELALSLPDGSRRELVSAHGGVYELGMRERDHGVPIAPFEDW